MTSGGAEKNCVIICNELVKKGIDVELWITRLGNAPLLKLIDPRVHIRSIPGKRIRYTFLHLKRLMVNCKSKTLLIFNMELLVPAFFINKIYHLNLKIVGRSISTLSLSYNHHSLLSKHIWFRLITFTLNRIDSIVAQSSGMKEDLIKNLNIAESKITIIPNPAYNFPGKKAKSRVNINPSEEILFIGRLTSSKGINYLLDIFTIAHSNLPNLHLTIVGEGDLKKYIEDQIMKRELSKSITLEGYQTDLAAYYTHAKATALTSLCEGFPNVLVESISFGTPVIAFDCQSGPRDIIIENVNGILIEFLNVKEFANAINDVVTQRIIFDKQKVIESSRKFNIDKIIDHYEKILFE